VKTNLLLPQPHIRNGSAGGLQGRCERDVMGSAQRGRVLPVPAVLQLLKVFDRLSQYAPRLPMMCDV
jgi:hypothetical protein